MNDQFFSALGERPVRLTESTRKLAFRALSGEFGRIMSETPSVDLDDIMGFDKLTDVQKYACAIMEIAKKAPVRILAGEKIAGSATLDCARLHQVPAYYLGKPVFRSVSHLTPGFSKILKTGCGGLRDQVNERLLRGDLDPYSIDFLNGMLTCLEAFRIWHQRYLDRLEDLIRKSEYSQKQEYMELYENLKSVPENPPKTFREAVQSLWFMFAFLRLCGNWPGIGRIDEMLGDYLQKDLEKGILTLDEAREILAHFWIKGCEWITGEKTVSGDAQHYQNIILAGIDEKGIEVTNAVTYLVLDVVEELGISDFPIAVRFNKKTPEKLIERIAETERHGGGVVAVYNENLIIKSLVAFGYDENEARNFANDGCWEVQIPGKTCFDYTPINILAIFQNKVLKLNDDSKLVSYGTFEELYEKYRIELDSAISEFHRQADCFATDPSPSILIALFTEGCIEKAKDYHNRGAVYTINSPHAGLLPDTANSLLAIRKFVYEEKLLTLQALISNLKSNWVGAEDLRRHIANSIEYYGNDNAEADAMTKRVLHDFIDIVSKVKRRNGVLRPAGVSTFGRQIDWHWDNGATADGHFKGEILSGNLSPSPGTDKNGVTAVIKSHCSLGLERLTCGTALDIKLLPSSVKGAEGIEALKSLLCGFVSLDGIFMQVDVIDNSILYEAQKHPEKYQNLAVRVAGWSARFVTLSSQWQDMIIGRMAH